jgi:DNA-3-methyladenine glycosylase
VKERLERSFFMRNPVTVARELVGCTLMWESCCGVVTETEAYAAEGDPACHTFTRPSARRFIEINPPGAAYVYFNYGMYWMLNVLVKGSGTEGAGFVLFRAMEPLEGIPEMRARRAAARRGAASIVAHELCAGPGRLAVALGVDAGSHGRDFCNDNSVALLPNASSSSDCVVDEDMRIGISRAKEFPWRFVLRGTRHVSRPVSGRNGTGHCGKPAENPKRSQQTLTP